jgi:hypothetical protein
MKKFFFLFAIAFAVSSFTVASLQNGGRPLTATLLGSNEVPIMGDPDGSGSFEMTLNLGQGTLTYELNVSGIEPATMAHIHVGGAGVAGGVVVPLQAPTDGSSSGTLMVSKELARAMLKNPEGYYVNVHNADYPGGALRGQLMK